MGGSFYFTNSTVNEGSVSSETTITFPARVGRILIHNDSQLHNLEFKFYSNGTALTLKPTEVAEIEDFLTKTLILDSPSTNSVGYRVWAYF